MVADGPAISTIVGLLANHCRAAQQRISTEDGDIVLKTSPLGLDRSCYTGHRSRRNRVEDHPAYIKSAPSLADMAGKKSDLDGRSKMSDQSSSTVPTKPASHDIVIKVYRITEKGLQDLKAAATITRISTHDALCALLWRGIIVNQVASKVLDFAGEDDSTCFIPVNTRRHMDLDEAFIGNAVYQTRCSITFGQLLAANGLSVAAARIRNAINAIDADVVAGNVNMFEDLSDLRMVAWAGPTHIQTKDVACSSFCHNEALYTLDWGPAFGHKVVRIRPSELGFTGGWQGTHNVLP